MAGERAEQNTPFDRINNIKGEKRQGVSQIETPKGSIGIVRVTAGGSEIVGVAVLLHDFEPDYTPQWTTSDSRVGAYHITRGGVEQIGITNGLMLGREVFRMDSVSSFFNGFSSDNLATIRQALATGLADFLEAQVLIEASTSRSGDNPAQS